MVTSTSGDVTAFVVTKSSGDVAAFVVTSTSGDVAAFVVTNSSGDVAGGVLGLPAAVNILFLNKFVEFCQYSEWYIPHVYALISTNAVKTPIFSFMSMNTRAYAV